MRCREMVRAEFERRRQANHRYSLRRFARALGVHHATLSRLFRGHRPLPPAAVRGLATRLGVATPEVERLIARETAAAVIAAIRAPGFRPDSRQLAMRAGIAVDNVNIALHALLRDGQLRMVSPREWIITPGENA